MSNLTPYILEKRVDDDFVDDPYYWILRTRRGEKIFAQSRNRYENLANLNRAVRQLPFDWTKIEVWDIKGNPQSTKNFGRYDT